MVNTNYFLYPSSLRGGTTTTNNAGTGSSINAGNSNTTHEKIPTDEILSSLTSTQAFLVTAGAGLTTVLGALLVNCVKNIDEQLTSSLALAFAAGVMLYASFVEILGHESKHKFKEAGYGDVGTEGFVQLFFAIGFCITFLLITKVFHPMLEGHSSEDQHSDRASMMSGTIMRKSVMSLRQAGSMYSFAKRSGGGESGNKNGSKKC